MYNAEISAGSLMPQESKRIAALLLTHPSQAAWETALKSDNFLQKKTLATARRQSRLIRNRLQTLQDTGLELVSTGNQEVSVQMLLVSAIKHSQLLADFIRSVYQQAVKAYEDKLAAKHWDSFIEECSKRDPAVAGWSDSTKAKLFQVLVRMLAEAKFLESSRSMRLTPQALHPEVIRYLKSHSETEVLLLLEARS